MYYVCGCGVFRVYVCGCLGLLMWFSGFCWWLRDSGSLVSAGCLRWLAVCCLGCAVGDFGRGQLVVLVGMLGFGVCLDLLALISWGVAIYIFGLIAGFGVFWWFSWFGCIWVFWGTCLPGRLCRFSG